MTSNVWKILHYTYFKNLLYLNEVRQENSISSVKAKIYNLSALILLTYRAYSRVALDFIQEQCQPGA